VWDQLATLARSTMYDPANLRMSGAYWPLTTACFLVGLLHDCKQHVNVLCYVVTDFTTTSMLSAECLDSNGSQTWITPVCCMQLRLQVARDVWLGNSSKNKSHRRFFRQVLGAWQT
jgi:hypothetical protein